MSIGDQHLTSPDPSLDKQIRATHRGQAHWALSGPQGETCRTYKLWTTNLGDDPGYYAGLRAMLKPRNCARYKELMHAKGPPVPHHAGACRHWELNPKAPEPTKGGL